MWERNSIFFLGVQVFVHMCVRNVYRVSGVNVVLNSLAEEKLQASLRCLARHGRFLEIGKYDLSNNSPLGQYEARSQPPRKTRTAAGLTGFGSRMESKTFTSLQAWRCS